MDVILLDAVHNLGRLGDRVSVKPGYARNYLIPQGKAVRATPKMIESFEQRRAELEAQAAARKAQAETRCTALDQVVLRMTARAIGDEQRLYGSITAADVVHAAREQGVALERSELHLPGGPIRELGEHRLSVHLYTDVEATITVLVEKQL